MAINYVQGQDYYLASSGIGTTDTSIILTTLTLPNSEELITMTMFGDLGYATLEPETSREENISFTGITQNANGTATLTGVTRGLDFVTPYTQDTNLRQAHAGSTILRFTNSAPFYNLFGNKNNDETVTGYWLCPDPLSATGIANRQWVLSVINGGAVSTDSIIVEAIAGTTIAAGDLVVFDLGQNEWMLADATDLDRLYNCKFGIAQGAGTNGTTITNGVLTRGFYTTSGLTKGDLLYVSDTAGDWANTSGTYVRAIGVAVTSTQMYFDSDFPNIRYNFGIDQDSSNANIFLPFIPNWQIYGSDSNEVAVGTTIFFQAATTNTGDSTLDINNDARYIRKNGSSTLVAGDIITGGIYGCIYDGTYWQMITPTANVPSGATPVVRTYTTESSAIGGSTTQFDITNPSGTTFRYTWDSTGTDPNISAANNPVGSLINFQAQNFTAANNGIFAVTGVDTNYVEVTNASGVAESNKTIGTGHITISGTTGWSKPTGLKYITVEVQGAGGGGGGHSGDNHSAGGASGGYARKVISASSLSSTEYYLVGADGAGGSGANPGSPGRASSFGTIVKCFGGQGGVNGDGSSSGGTATGGDVNINGNSGGDGNGNASSDQMGGPGADSILGIGGKGFQDSGGGPATGYGAGGGGAGATSGSGNGGAGSQGIVIVTEYY